MQFSFRRNGVLRSDMQVASNKLQIFDSWKIDKESKLVFPAGGKAENRNLKTGSKKVESVNGTMHNDIVALTNSRLIFEREGGGEVCSCRK